MASQVEKWIEERKEIEARMSRDQIRLDRTMTYPSGSHRAATPLASIDDAGLIQIGSRKLNVTGAREFAAWIFAVTEGYEAKGVDAR